MDAVYIVAEQPDHEDLRYSLRSLWAHFRHDRVWIVGDLPDWAAGVTHLPTDQSSTVWTNSTNNLLAACLQPDLSDEFVFICDDHFILRPVTEIPVHHQGPITHRYPRATGPVPVGDRRYSGMEGTYRLLVAWGASTYWNYELHIPMVLHKEKMAETIRRARLEDALIDRLRKRTLYGNIWDVGGTQIADVTSRHYEDTWEPEQMFVSTSDRSFRDWPVGTRLRETFPDPCPYEKEAA